MNIEMIENYMYHVQELDSSSILVVKQTRKVLDSYLNHFSNNGAKDINVSLYLYALSFVNDKIMEHVKHLYNIAKKEDNLYVKSLIFFHIRLLLSKNGKITW